MTMGWRVRSFAAERALVDEDRVDPPEFNVRDMVRIRSIIRMMVMFGLFIRTVQSGVFCLRWCCVVACLCPLSFVLPCFFKVSSRFRKVLFW